MKSSAIVTALSFLAATALGAALITGCELSSSTVDDTDGGDPPPNNNDSGAKDSSTNTDGGTEAGSCGKEVLVSATCQACLDNKCCGVQQTCYAFPAGNSTLDCSQFIDCLAGEGGGKKCDEQPSEAEQTECYDLCAFAAGVESPPDGPGYLGADPKTTVPGAYRAIVDCAATSCKTECEF